MTAAANTTTDRFRLLILVTSDPLTNGRLAEAIRLSAGVSAWQKVQVTVFVGGRAVAGLITGDGRFVDEENIVEYLPMLREHNQELYLEHGHPLLQSHPAELPFPMLDVNGLAKLVAGQDYVMRF